MLILRDPSQLGQVENAYIRGLIAQRFQEITIDGYSYEDLGMFVLAEPGDSIAELEKAGGVWITTGIFTEAKYGDPDFAPCFEVLEEHPDCFEMIHTLAGDFGVCTVIPDVFGIDDELLRFCKEFAVPLPPAATVSTGNSYDPGA